MRASWLAQRIVEEFHEHIARFDLEEGDAGDFDFYVNGELAYAARDTGYYPHIDQLREAVSTAIAAAETKTNAGSERETGAAPDG